MVMRIGIDFDNTIAGYDALFAEVAHQKGLIPPEAEFPGTKKDVRDTVRREAGEAAWQRLQAVVYGPRMGDAVLIDGVGAFLDACAGRRLAVFVVSHKTAVSPVDCEGVDLRRAAWDWLEARGFFAPDGFALTPGHVFFEDTRQAKIARIAALGCSHYIDDLEEVFQEDSFPPDVRRILFFPGNGALPSGPFRAFRSWPDITHDIFGTA